MEMKMEKFSVAASRNTSTSTSTRLPDWSSNGYTSSAGSSRKNFKWKIWQTDITVF